MISIQSVVQALKVLAKHAEEGLGNAKPLAERIQHEVRLLMTTSRSDLNMEQTGIKLAVHQARATALNQVASGIRAELSQSHGELEKVFSESYFTQGLHLARGLERLEVAVFSADVKQIPPNLFQAIVAFRDPNGSLFSQQGAAAALDIINRVKRSVGASSLNSVILQSVETHMGSLQAVNVPLLPKGILNPSETRECIKKSVRNIFLIAHQHKIKSLLIPVEDCVFVKDPSRAQAALDGLFEAIQEVCRISSLEKLGLFVHRTPVSPKNPASVELYFDRLNLFTLLADRLTLMAQSVKPYRVGLSLVKSGNS